MLLPEHCSIKKDGEECQHPPSYVVSIASQDGEYMVSVVCDYHKTTLAEWLIALQNENKMPQGDIRFEPIKAVATNCIVGMYDDYIDIELKRGIESDRSI
jgi:hypothetical protein